MICAVDTYALLNLNTVKNMSRDNIYVFTLL